MAMDVSTRGISLVRPTDDTRVVRRSWRAPVISALVLVLTLGGLAASLLSFEGKAKTELEDRFASRVALASQFVHTYVSQLAEREALVAREHLSGPIKNDDIEVAAAAAGLQRAVVLDERGRLLASYPASPDARGQNIASDYAHLAAGVRGEVGVSGVVPALVNGDPVVAVAVPFDTPSGRRVFSGGFLTSDMPLEAYLDTLFSFKGMNLALVDGAGNPIAVGARHRDGGSDVALDPKLSEAVSRGGSGWLTHGDEDHLFVARTDPNGWTLAATVPGRELFAPLGSSWDSRLIWSLFAVVGVMAVWAVIRLSDGGRQLAAKHAEVRRLNEELDQRVERRTAELEAANHELESFAYSVSHDLRAPLRGINGFSKILAEELGDRLEDRNKRFFEMICTNAERMQELIDDLLRFSRLHRQPLRVREVDIDSLVENVRAELTHAGLAERTEWRIEPLGRATADPSLLKQVFVNLVENALKYSRSRDLRIIDIGVSDADGETVFHVRDNGVGFDNAYAHKLFGVFQRLHRAEEYEGTGVGLATVQRIVHRHGGRLWAEGTPDQGAAFYFTIGEPDANG